MSKFTLLYLCLETRHAGKQGATPPLSEGVPNEITLIRLSQVSLDRRKREKVIWAMYVLVITAHNTNMHIPWFLCQVYNSYLCTRIRIKNGAGGRKGQARKPGSHNVLYV